MKGNLVQSKYRILHTLGKSKFSETVIAKDRQKISRRKYVIKKFRPILGNSQAEEIRRLFTQESKILQRLDNHPQIPQLYESFMDGEDLYLVREWVQGITLEQHVQQYGVLSETEAKQILNSILEVLKYIHGHGIVYHQLKPSSILLRQQNWWKRLGKEDYLPVPIYFGGVKELENQKSQRNLSNAVIDGHKGYISPEQKQGESFYASDLYSLGLTIIFLLTGKTPTALNSNSFNNKLLWREEAPNLTTNLARVVDRAISYVPRDRFTSAEEMLQALNSQPILISEAITNQLPKEPLLTPEVKITSLLFAAGFGTMGIFFGLLNIDFDQFNLGDKEGKENTIAKINRTPHSFQESSSVNKLATTSKPTNVLDNNKSKRIARMDDMTEEPRDSNYIAKPMRTDNLVPAFAVGDTTEQMIETLGEPTMESPGYWGNSRAFSYFNYAPDMYALGYLSDRETDKIRQTEITFVESAKLGTIHQAVNDLMLDDYSPEIEYQINKVFSRSQIMQEFTSGNLSGVIQRNSLNGIYIGVWDKDFH